MHYDPIKAMLGTFFNQAPVLRKLFYRLLDLLLLRTWHVKKALKEWGKTHIGVTQILDAGMGFGQYSYWMASHNKQWRVHGVDVKEEQIADCKAFFTKVGLSNASFGYADLVQFKHPSAYDLIVSVDVMEHILEDDQVFKNFFGSLKPGGMLLVSTPSDQGGSDVHHHDHEDDGSGSFIGEHVRDGYNIQAIQQQLTSAGFSSTSAKYTYGCPGKISWKLSMKYPILMLNASKLLLIVLPFYYLVVFPFALVLNYIDVRAKHKSGTGLLVTAIK